MLRIYKKNEYKCNYICNMINRGLRVSVSVTTNITVLSHIIKLDT
jgi:hypothetical protein